MKSLFLQTINNSRLIPYSEDELKFSSIISVNTDDDSLYVACYSESRNENVIFKITLENNSQLVEELMTFPSSNTNVIVGLQVLSENQTICVAFSNGDIYTINLNSQIENIENECVGSIDSGILCMSWSPDQEIVVFVTGEKKIIEMNKFFDVLNEIPI